MRQLFLKLSLEWSMDNHMKDSKQSPIQFKLHAIHSIFSFIQMELNFQKNDSFFTLIEINISSLVGHSNMEPKLVSQNKQGVDRYLACLINMYVHIINLLVTLVKTNMSCGTQVYVRMLIISFTIDMPCDTYILANILVNSITINMSFSNYVI